MASDYITPAIAVVGTIFGGAGLEFTKRWLNRNKEKSDVATDFRAELRADLTAVKEELEQVEAELTQWKDKYYDLLEKFIKVKSDYEEALRKLQAQAASPPPVDTGPAG